MAKGRYIRTKSLPVVVASLMGELAIHASMDMDRSGILYSAHFNTVHENAFVSISTFITSNGPHHS